ncbi:MAG: ABC transporter substrate-binding protein [Deltaproteobacteria bacterium]|nr:ABC transporter substrate-binding protein [Deltaproteobacteria bacterium]
MKRMLQMLLPAVLVTGLSISSAMAKTVRIGIPGISGTLLPLYVTQDAGFFEKHSLETELITMRSGSVAIQSLLAREIQFGASGTSSGVDAKVAGADIVAITEYINTLPYALVASERIRNAEQLRGRRFAVSRLGAISDIALRLALRNLGIDPSKEAVILGIGDAASRFSALRAGTVDATVISPPDTLLARKLGFNLIASFPEAKLRFAYGSIFITTDFGRKSREMVLNFLKGFVEGIAYIHKNKEGSLRILSKWTRNQDREALEETYNFFLNIYPKKPYSTDETMQALLEVMGERNSEVKKFKPSDFNDMQFLREIDKTGSIDRLYR